MMKKYSSILFVLCMTVFVAAKVVALPTLPSLAPLNPPSPTAVQGESDYIRPITGEIAHVDWIVTPTDLTSGQGFTSSFFHGDSTGFNSSKYYYFYQIENTTSSNISTLMLNVNPANIKSAGFLMHVDLDSAPFSHFVPLESETASTGPIDPSSTLLSIPGVSHVTWMFHVPIIGVGEYSTVLFLSSDVLPQYQLSHIGAGSPALAGTLPAPSLSNVVIPEPLSIMLLGSTIVGIILRRRK